MKKCELITVIITAYNEEKTIERAINSILDQTYKNIELIVVNDGSTDDTQSYIDKCLLLKQFYVIRNKKPTGLMAARNIGVQHSKGTYISFLDGDDAWDHKKAEIQLNHLKKLNTESILFTARIVYSINGKPHIFNKKSISNKLFYLSYNQVLQKKNMLPLGASMMLEKSTFQKLGGFDENAGKERDLISRIGVMGGQIAWLGIPLYIQYRKANSMSTDIEKTLHRELNMIKCWHPDNMRHWSRNISAVEFKKYNEKILSSYYRKLDYFPKEKYGKNFNINLKGYIKKTIYKILKPYSHIVDNYIAQRRYKKWNAKTNETA